MSREELRQWAPWALDNLQPAKRLVQIMANVLVVLALAQVAGVDIEGLTNGNVVPPEDLSLVRTWPC